MRPPIRDPAVLERMQVLFDLYQTAEDMMRQNLRRKFQQATPEEIEERLLSWLRDRPGAERGDYARSAGAGNPGRTEP